MMRRGARPARALLPLVAAAILIAPAPAECAPAAPLDAPVVVPAHALGRLLGEPIGSLRLLRWTGESFAVVPFQIDPRERRAHPGRRPRRLHVLATPGERDIVDARPLAPDDELVFMRSDLGSVPPRGEAPPGSRTGALIEIDRGGAAALFAFDAPPPRSARRYVQSDARGDRIEARAYTLAFSRARPGILETLRLHPVGTQSTAATMKQPADPEPPDILDRVKIRISGRLLHLIPIRVDEGDIETRVAGLRAGPVRVVRVCRHRVPLVPGIRSPWVVEAQIFYPDGFEFPLWLAKPPKMRRLLTHLSFRVGPDWSPAARGLRVRVPGAPAAAVVDGRMDAAERALDSARVSWSVLIGEQAAYFSRLDRGSGEGGATKPDVRVRYRDNADRADAPEDHPGEIGSLAYEVHDATGLPAGEYRWTVRTRVLPDFMPGDERMVLKALAPATLHRVIEIPPGPRGGSP